MDLHGVEWLAGFAYVDESGTNNAADLLVAGYLFSRNAAKLFRDKVRENIEPLLPPNKHGKRVYHSSLCIGGYKQFEPISLPQRERIVELLSDYMVEAECRPSLGVLTGLPKSEYAHAISISPLMRNASGDPYSNCLLRSIENIAGWLNKPGIRG